LLGSTHSPATFCRPRMGRLAFAASSCDITLRHTACRWAAALLLLLLACAVRAAPHPRASTTLIARRLQCRNNRSVY
jgi:hypothetical protein